MQILHRGIFMPAFDRILQLARMEEMDCEFVEVTAHEGARHNFYPFYPGVSVRNYTDERLAELDARNIPYGGGLYTKYEITQMQRALEQRVRGQQLLVEVDNADNGENVE